MEFKLEDVQDIAEEYGYPPEKLVTFMNESERLITERQNQRSKEDYEFNKYLADLADKLGIPKAGWWHRLEIKKADAWKAFQADPKNNPFPPRIKWEEEYEDLKAPEEVD